MTDINEENNKILDVVDENDNIIDLKSRTEIHRLGLFHREIKKMKIYKKKKKYFF